MPARVLVQVTDANRGHAPNVQRFQPLEAGAQAAFPDRRPATVAALQLQELVRGSPRSVAPSGRESVPGGATPLGTAPIQRVAQDVAVTGLTHLVSLNPEGSLYDADYARNEVREVGTGDFVEIDTDAVLRSRRGPNQEVPENSARDRTGPSQYLWYRVLRVNGVAAGKGIYIRHGTFRSVNVDDERALPTRSTVYGTADIDQANLQLAYDEGFRDFDTAYMYHYGKTADMFAELRKEEGPVRLIYKFKLEEQQQADQELAALSQLEGVIIHTIMLHEIPAALQQRTAALTILKEFCGRYGAVAGLSNVIEERIDSDENLTRILELAEQIGFRVGSVQNRLTPSAPDAAVRAACAERGIGYMGFGLKGGERGGFEGTCKMDAGSTTENYDITADPLFIARAAELGVGEGMLRHVMLEWARQQGVSAISQSTSPEGMRRMRAPFPPELIDLLDIYGDGNEHFPHHPEQAGPYLPFELYIESLGVAPTQAQRLLNVLPLNLWRKFYKYSIATHNRGRDDFAATMANMDSAKMERLMQFMHRVAHASVSDLNNLFQDARYGLGDGDAEAVERFGPTLTDQQMHEIDGALDEGSGKKIYLIDEDYMGVPAPAALAARDEVRITIPDASAATGVQVLATYVKNATGTWDRQ